MSEATHGRKINIHLAFDGSGIEYCRAVNAAIRRVAPSTVVFDETSPMIPHLTLRMGVLHDSARVDDVVTVVTAVTRDCQAITLRLSPPALGAAKPGYIVSDVRLDAAAMALRQRIREQTQDALMAGPPDDDEAHVTLAYVDPAPVHLANLAAWLAQNAAPVQFAAVAMAVADVGAHGSCISTLCYVPFGA